MKDFTNLWVGKDNIKTLKLNYYYLQWCFSFCENVFNDKGLLDVNNEVLEKRTTSNNTYSSIQYLYSCYNLNWLRQNWILVQSVTDMLGLTSSNKHWQSANKLSLMLY